MPQIKVTVQEGAGSDDQAVYFTDEVSYEVRKLEPDTKIVYAIFTPSNGRDRGAKVRVPMGRVLAVAER